MISAPIRCEHVTRSFPTGNGHVVAVRDATLTVGRSELVALIGPSGSGKTTLLGLVGGLDLPDHGSIWVADHELTQLPRDELPRFRRRHVGFVFQSPALIPLMTAFENVQLVLQLSGWTSREGDRMAWTALELVGLVDRARHRTYELSGGEQQRVAIARAIAKSPSVLIADEPTGELDGETAQGIISLLLAVSRSGTAVLVATHDQVLANSADRMIRVQDGALLKRPDSDRDSGVS